MLASSQRFSPRVRLVRAEQLRTISEALLDRGAYGTPTWSRGRRALFLAILLEQDLTRCLFANLRRRAKRSGFQVTRPEPAVPVPAQHRAHGGEGVLWSGPDGELVVHPDVADGREYERVMEYA